MDKARQTESLEQGQSGGETDNKKYKHTRRY